MQNFFRNLILFIFLFFLIKITQTCFINPLFFDRVKSLLALFNAFIFVRFVLGKDIFVFLFNLENDKNNLLHSFKQGCSLLLLKIFFAIFTYWFFYWEIYIFFHVSSFLIFFLIKNHPGLAAIFIVYLSPLIYPFVFIDKIVNFIIECFTTKVFYFAICYLVMLLFLT